MKRRPVTGVAFICIVAIIIVAAILHSPPAQGKPVPQSAGSMPAIHPNAVKFQTRTLPTFTTATVEQYLTTDPFMGQELNARPGFKHTITFMDSRTLGQKLKVDFSKDATTLCYVEFTGPALFGLNDVKAIPPPLFSKAYEVFDGLNGDLITWGGYIKH